VWGGGEEWYEIVKNRRVSPIPYNTYLTVYAKEMGGQAGRWAEADR